MRADLEQRLRDDFRARSRNNRPRGRCSAALVEELEVELPETPDPAGRSVRLIEQTRPVRFGPAGHGHQEPVTPELGRSLNWESSRPEAELAPERTRGGWRLRLLATAEADRRCEAGAI